MNASPVQCVPGKTLFSVKDGEKESGGTGCKQYPLGESITVWGKLDKKSGVVTASRLVTDKPVPLAVNGYSVIDKVLRSYDGTAVTVRVDGYPVVLTAVANATFASPLHSLSDVGTNMWIRYAGKLGTDGTVIATSATLEPNKVVKREEKLRQKNEFDAATVSEDRRQGQVSKYLWGWDYKRIPAYQDAALDERIQRVGTRLVPAYQRALATDDPSRLAFRFQLVDQPKVNDVIALPSGIVLVPYQLVQRLPSDDELAAVLSTGLAHVMEKHWLRQIPASNAMTATNLAGSVAGIFVPGLGLATSLTNYKIGKNIATHATQQDLRIGLAWMQDAGYDVTTAPRVWWLLAAKSGKSLQKTRMPDETQYLYLWLSTAHRQDRLLPEDAPNPATP